MVRIKAYLKRKVEIEKQSNTVNPTTSGSTTSFREQDSGKTMDSTQTPSVESQVTKDDSINSDEDDIPPPPPPKSRKGKEKGIRKGQGKTKPTQEERTEEEESADEEKGNDQPEPQDSDNKTGKSKKKPKTVIVLTDQQEDDVAEWIQSHPELYDKACKEYKNAEKKGTLWAEKAAALELSDGGAALKNWYMSMRTRYGKLTETKSGSGPRTLTPRDSWIVGRFAFLEGHIVRLQKHRTGGLNIKRKTKEDQEDDEEETEFGDALEESRDELAKVDEEILAGSHVCSNTSSMSTSDGIPGKRRKKISKGSNSELALLSKLAARAEQSQKLQENMTRRLEAVLPTAPPNARTQWGAWLSSSIGEVHDTLWDDFQSQSFQLVTSFVRQSRQLREREQQAQPIYTQLTVPGPAYRQAIPQVQVPASVYHQLQTIPVMQSASTPRVTNNEPRAEYQQGDLSLNIMNMSGISQLLSGDADTASDPTDN